MVRRLLALALTSAFVLGTSTDARSQDGGTSGQRSPELEAAVRALVNDRTLKDAQIGVVVMDAESGNVLAASGEHIALNPASNAKVYTAAAALAILHGSHKYQTTLSGTIKGGGATGITLRGHGDPSLETRDLYELVSELKMHGARRVDGDIHVDQKFFDEQTTPPAFEQQPNEWASFRAPVSAVALNGNTVTLVIRPNSAGNAAFASFDPPGFVDVDGTRWQVKEMPFSNYDRRRGLSLIFWSDGAVRRVRDYPANWHELPDVELALLSWKV